MPIPFLISTKVFPISDRRRRCRRLLRSKSLIVVFRDSLPIATHDTGVFLINLRDFCDALLVVAMSAVSESIATTKELRV